jgi:hypothetical protein
LREALGYKPLSRERLFVDATKLIAVLAVLVLAGWFGYKTL